MDANATLDEFEPDDNDPSATTTPIEPVLRWHPDDATCPRCGESVQERWTDDAIAAVCVSCKEW